MNSYKTARVSKIALPDPLWRYLILFQSWGQFFSWVTIIGAFLGAIAFFIWLTGDARHIPKCVAWGLVGGAWSLLFASKAQFSIRSATNAEKASFKKMLEECMYVERHSTEHEKRFGQNLPRFLRWSDSDVTIRERDGVVVCTGPQLLIRKMRKMVL